jgi:acetamidase/formamidase
MTQHTLRAAPDTVRIGVFNAMFPPVMTIEPGDTVTVQCVSGRESVMPPAGSPFTIPPELFSREQAYSFCSLAVDFHVTQSVNGEKGVHGMLKKGLLF